MRLLTFLLMAALALPGVTLAQVPSGPYLAVQGHAESKVVPDIFPVEINISDVGTDSAASQALVEDLARKVLDAARKLSIADEDIQVGNLHISPQTRWDKDSGKNVFLGNEYERNFRIRLKALTDLRRLVALLPEGRNLQVRTVAFDRSDRAQIIRKLRKQAVDDASAAARELSEFSNVKLGRLYNVSDRPQNLGYYRYAGYSGSVNGIDVASVDSSNVLTSEMIVKEGQITLSFDVYLVYEIAEGR